jgi:hypothetical protein
LWAYLLPHMRYLLVDINQVQQTGAQPALLAAGHCAGLRKTNHPRSLTPGRLRGADRPNLHADHPLPRGQSAAPGRNNLRFISSQPHAGVGAYPGSVAGQRRFAPLPAGLQLSRRKGYATDTGSFAKFLTKLGKWGKLVEKQNPGPGSHP